ncbi:MAG: hypothetical protein GY873_13640 [Bosea sp.]|uniref:hypothetical protein n=1 Tax=Bosea sp. (in: a-proteobacteria) TaxID=1871050 RepID=UPI00239EFD85|nr:hypothetical protein [Bosea sp. (in: a-proteobacteria)]MCP4735223.1 hypothetical protein [Bosea sp. (in: a-proteobacteria)]
MKLLQRVAGLKAASPLARHGTCLMAQLEAAPDITKPEPVARLAQADDLTV